MYSGGYHHKSASILMQAREKYAWLFGIGLSDESIEARYHLLEYLQIHYGYRGRLEKDSEGKPIHIRTVNGIYCWSLSHSRNHVAFSISESPTGIDIAEYEERDDSLLDLHTDSEYRILGGKNWENFYILWTAKEALIKSVGNSLDDLENIEIFEIQKEGIYIFGFLGKTYTIQFQKYGSLFLSVTR